MASKPRLYARARVNKMDAPLLSESKPDIFILLDDKNDTETILKLFSVQSILYRTMQSSSIDLLDQYYKSYSGGNQTVYLIISDSIAEELNRIVKTRKHFYTVSTVIYTLYPFEDYHKCDEDLNRFNDAEELGRSLRSFLSSFLTLDDVELSSQSVSIKTPRFAWFQFMFTLLSHLKQSDISMKEVIYRLNKYNYISRSKQFEEFVKTYTADQAIEWCMKDSFYFTHINRILREKDINKIFAHRALIHDIDDKLISLHNEHQSIWDRFLPMHVYRGQKTSKQELESWQSNIGSIITMNSFFSTTMDEKTADLFAETFHNEDDDDKETLFKIRLDKNIAPKAIYVYLYHDGYDDIDDCEILFSLRTLFRIEKVKCSKFEEKWYIDLTVVDEDHADVQRLLSPWKTSIFQQRHINEELIYVQNLSADNGRFLTFQLSLDIILRLDRNDFARQEMISMCREKFYQDQLELIKINQFEVTYRSENDAVKWYTNDTFLYRFLNEILRSETVDSIFKFRYYIQDLHNHLALLHLDYLKKLKHCSILTLYRGQTMTWKDFETKFQRNKGNLIAINNFLSTTTDRYIARIFSGDGFTENPDIYVSVLYEITIDIRLSHSIPFAKLNDQSNFEDENEVLFSMGATFRIDDLVEENKYLWTVKLTLITQEDEQWNILTEHLQQQRKAEENLSTTSQTSISNDEIINVRRERTRSRSFDEYRLTKHNFRRLNYSNTFRREFARHFEHPSFQTLYKEI